MIVRGQMKKKTITKAFRSNLAMIFTIALVASAAVVLILSTGTNKRNYKDIITSTISDVEKDIEETSDINMLEQTWHLADLVNARLRSEGGNPSADVMDSYLRDLVREENLSEMSIGDDKNIIIYSSIEEYLGFDMNSSEGSAVFDKLNHGTKGIVQPVRMNAYGGEGDYALYNKYAGVPLDSGGYLQIGISAQQFQQQIDEKVKYIAANRHIGQSGYVIISNSADEVISNAGGEVGVKNTDIGLEIMIGRDNDPNADSEKSYKSKINGVPCMCMSKFVEGYYITGVVPQSEVQSFRNRAALTNTVTELIIFLAMFIMIAKMIEAIIVSRIHNINGELDKIIDGNLDIKVEEYSTSEFEELSDGINATVDSLKAYMAKEKERIKKDLDFAANIQMSALPKMNSIQTDYKNYELFATINTAREVGGDFYDFYMLDDNRLAFLVADVSGKGVPAAMFMMTCKTMLKNFVESGLPLDEAFTKANNELVETNDAGMFVTVWMGILDLDTGHLQYINVGHNPPLFYDENGRFAYLKCKSAFVLTGVEGLKYSIQELNINPGDKIYLYTDGVTEANNVENAMYGEDRLKEYLNEHKDESLKEILLGVKADVDRFAGKAEQFDDITMLSVCWKQEK